MSVKFKAGRDVIVRIPQFAGAQELCGSVRGLPTVHRDASLVASRRAASGCTLNRGRRRPPCLNSWWAILARRALLEAGCEINEEDPGVPRCYVRDPYGLTFNIAQAREPD